MSLKSFLRKLFLGGETLECSNSTINGPIIVRESLGGEREMVIGGICQSGGLVKKLWREQLGRIGLDRPSRVLILGLGAGSLASLMAKKKPLGVEIVGVEVDPEVIRLAKKHFGLNQVKGLRTIIADGIELVNKGKLKGKFDLIVVDLYLGQEYPRKAEKKDFLERLGKSLSPGGKLVFNRLDFGSHRTHTRQFLSRIKEIYPVVVTKSSITNLVIFASF